jgi:hypothetical protein
MAFSTPKMTPVQPGDTDVALMMELLAAEYDEEPLGNGELEGLSDNYSLSS